MTTRFFFACTLMAFSLAAHAQQPQEPFDEKESRTAELVQRERMAWYEQCGVSPNDRLARWFESHSTNSSTIQSNTVPTFLWENLGPHNQSGRVVSEQYVPNTLEIVAMTSGGGIWKLGRDTVWRVKSDAFPSLKMTTSAMAPTNCAIMAAGTDEGFVYLSSDSGTTWSVAPASPGGAVQSLTYHPTNAKLLYACGDFGIKSTTDKGITWTALPGIGQGRVRHLLIDPTTPTTMYAGRVQWEWPTSTVEIMKSTNGGTTFNTVLTNSGGYWSDVLITMCASMPGVLWAGFDSEHKYYRSRNGGLTWDSCKTRPWSDSYYNGFWMCAAYPYNQNVCFAGGPGLFRTTDIGATWTRADSGVHADFHTMAFLPGGRAVLGCDGGVYQCDNVMLPTPIWKYQSYGLETLESYNIACSPVSENIITGCQDNGYDKFTGNDYGWSIVGGDGFACLFNQQQPNIFYHEYTNMNLHRATDGFTWWSTKVMNGLPAGPNFYDGISSEPVDWYGQAVTISPTNGSLLYCGTDKVYVTDNDGNDWGLLSNYVLSPGGALGAIALSPIDSNIIYIGSLSGDIAASLDGGSTWRKTDAASLGGGSRVFSIVCDPKHRLTAYASMSAGTSTIFRTTNGGVTWDTSFRSGLSATSPRRLAFDPMHPDTLYLGTLHGLYSRTTATPWQPVSGLPAVEIWDLAWENSNDGAGGKREQLLVGSYGRGVYRGTFATPMTVLPAVTFAASRVFAAHDSVVKGLIVNTSQNDVTVTALSVSGSVAFSVVSPIAPVVIASGKSLSITFRFQPQSTGAANATLRIDCSAAGSPVFTTLSAVAVLPQLSATPDSIDFGTVQIGSTRDTVFNLNVSTLFGAPDSARFTAFQLMGIRSSAFSLIDSVMPFTVHSGVSSVVRLSYHPTAAGISNGALKFSIDGTDAPYMLQLHGSGQTGSGVFARTAISPQTATLSITPQAAGDMVRASFTIDENYLADMYSVELVDALGRCVQRVASGRVDANEMHVPAISVRDFAPGLYALRLTVAGEVVGTGMFVVAR